MGDQKPGPVFTDYLNAPTEAEAIAQFMEIHAEIIEQLRVLLELTAARGLPVSLVASMLIGGAVGGLLEAGLPADEIRRFATDAVDGAIKQLQERARA